MFVESDFFHHLPDGLSEMLGPALGTSMVKARLLFHGHRRQSERFGLPPPIFEKYVKLPG